MTAPFDLLIEWSRRLRLTDWEINLHMVQPEFFKDEEGCNRYDDHEKVSDIFISERSKDIECVIVHELLHLHFSSIETPRDSAADLCLERGINAITRLLLQYERRE